ncbi:neutral zinc metallopeptidase [Nocardia sp. NPDC051030]|uniref:neutral zinc metallopeptidase n=1 Tax=Nocardia sp. NPDC051030 TaxID=3155162 RepID=UPI00343FF86E
MSRQSLMLAIPLVIVLGVFVGLVTAQAIRADDSNPNASAATTTTTLRPVSTSTIPTTFLKPVAATPEANTLNSGLRLPDWQCELQPLNDMSAESQRTFVESGLQCLERIWLPALRDANIVGTVPPVKLVLVENDQPACNNHKTASPTEVAFYCANTVYWPVADESRKDLGAKDWDLYLFLLMHEYGHHVQELTGLSRVADHRQQDAGVDSPTGLLLSRRVELQAQCLAGMAMAAAEQGGALSARKVGHIIDDESNMVEEEVHGSSASNYRWTQAGYRDRATTACNTWTAAPDEVN